ncbi:MAG: nucleoside recognition domain-containing protein [Lentihominibacter sp.]
MPKAVTDYLIFAAVMLAVFELTFNTLGKLLSTLLADALSSATSYLDAYLTRFDINPALHDLIINGVCPGVGSVLAFVPVIGVLFLLLGILQETGYLSEAAAVMEKPLSRLGLSGQCVVPLVMGFGCAVPAILSASSLSSYHDRICTIRLIPFMSCSARLPIYAMFISCFFPQHRISVLLGLYAAGILAAICIALITGTSGTERHICQRRRHYRMPDMRAVMSLVLVNVAGFIRKAFTVIFTASVLIWYLRSYNFDLQPVSDSSESILAFLGRTAAPIFAPLGFGDWRAAAAVIAGLTAKEAVISTLVVASSVSDQTLFTMLSEIFTPLSAFSFLLFCLLYMPCIATLCTVRNVTGSWRESLLMAALHIAAAWCASFAVYNVGTFISGLI